VRAVLQKRTAPHTYNVMLGGDVVGVVRRVRRGRLTWEADCQDWPRGAPYRSSTRRGAVELLVAVIEGRKKPVDAEPGPG
jgi:hypothetical protein